MIFDICFKIIQRRATSNRKTILRIIDGWVGFVCLVSWINRDNEAPEILDDVGR